MQTAFLKKFFTKNRTHAVKRQIMNLRQKSNDSYEVAWERFKDLLIVCPHHGYNIGRHIGYFYDGLLSDTKKYIDMMCNGTFFNKTQKEAWNYLEEISEHARRWGDTTEFDRTTPPQASKGVLCSIRKEDDFRARVDVEVAKRMQGLNLHQVTCVNSELFCVVCDRTVHETSYCPSLMAIKESI